METWRKAWRDGVAPQLPTSGLIALAEAIRNDDKSWSQGVTTVPPPLMMWSWHPVDKACAVGYCGWKGEGLGTVGEVDEFFNKICEQCDRLLGEPAAMRWFLNWADEHPREEVRAELLPEVEMELDKRGVLHGGL